MPRKIKEDAATYVTDAGVASTCLVTGQRALADALRKRLGGAKLQVRNQLADVIGDRDCSLYVIDTRVGDMKLWPALVLKDRHAESRRWLFLVPKSSDAACRTPMPPNSMSLELTRSTEELTDSIEKLVDPESRTRIAEVIYVAGIEAFFIRMGNARTYLLPLRELAEVDSSPVIRTSVARDRQYFRVMQASGNRLEVPWDVILYHCEPEYEYYKGKQPLEDDSTRRIGEKVRQMRMARGLSVEALARKAGMQRPNLSRLEHGKHRPSLETLERVARALGVGVAEMVAGGDRG
ncbi:MAG: helix-turn-helix domain-containing protein [Chloroflexi bacterium]|nr:helix-turn-helix domain-containing protein [Chloroflexota bacterium]